MFYVGQKAFIEKENNILLLIPPNGGIDFPGGKIQEGEVDLDISFMREVMKETGLKIQVGLPFYRWCFDLQKPHRNAGKKVFLLGFKCKYLSGSVYISSEHTKSQWVNKNSYRLLDNGSSHFKALHEYFNTI